MAQTKLDYNEWFFARFGQSARYADRTIPAGQGSLAAGTVMVLDPATNKYVKWDSASQSVLIATTPTSVTLDVTKVVGVCVLLEAIDATNEVTGKLGISGSVLASSLVLAGSTITTVTNYVKSVLQMNGIEVVTGSNALNVAGE